MIVAESKRKIQTPCCKQGVFFISGGGMKNILFLSMVVSLWLVSGCNAVGNAVRTTSSYYLKNAPEYIDICGDWRIEIICNAAENSCEIIMDENLQRSYSLRTGRTLKLSLSKNIKPLISPIVRIKTKKAFSELELDGNLICHVKGFNGNELEIDLGGEAVCVFDDGSAEKIEADISDMSKLSLKCKAKVLELEADKRAVFEAVDVDELMIDASENSICRIEKCEKAFVKACDLSMIEFKSIKSLQERLYDDAAVKYPIVVPESLKAGKGKK